MEQRLLWMFLALHKVESNNKKRCLLLIEVSQKQVYTASEQHKQETNPLVIPRQSVG